MLKLFVSFTINDGVVGRLEFVIQFKWTVYIPSKPIPLGRLFPKEGLVGAVFLGMEDDGAAQGCHCC